MDISNPIIFDTIKAVSGQECKCILIDIGVWDMDTTASVIVAHTITYTKILSVSVLIMRDGLTFRSNAYSTIFGAPTGGQYIIHTYNGFFSLERMAGGFYDNTFYNDVGISRGTIFVWYYV